MQEIINELFALGPEQLKKVKEFIDKLKNPKKQRSLDQNAMYWKLVYKLALKLKLSVEEVHYQLLKDYSVRYEILMPSGVKPRGIKYIEEKSKIKRDGKEYVVYWVFTPSHELKTDEFALLMEGLIRECENADISTLVD